MMKRPSDQLLAKRMLETREHGFSFALLVRRNAKRYLFLFAVLALAFLMFADLKFWRACYVLVGLLLGALLRDIGWFRAIGRTWPFSEKVTDWGKVQGLADGKDL